MPLKNKDYLRNANKFRTNFGAERNFLQKTDRILAERDTIKVRKGDPTSDAKRFIWLPFKDTEKDIKAKGGDYRDYIILLKGYNYHELGHILFTERSLKDEIDAVEEEINQGAIATHLSNRSGYQVKDELKTLINRLEDCRIEMRFTKLYKSSEKYIRATVDANINNVGFLDAYGRKFLPNKLRRKAQKEFMDENQAMTDQDLEDLKELIDKFLLEKDKDLRTELTARIYELLAEKTNMDNQPKGPSNNDRGHSEGYKNNKVNKKKEKDIDDEMQEDVENDDMDKDEEEQEKQQGGGQGEEKEEDRADGEKTPDNPTKGDKIDKENKCEEQDGKGLGQNQEGEEEFTPDQQGAEDSLEGETGNRQNMDKDTEDISEEDFQKLREELEDDLDRDIQTIKDGGGWSPYTKGKGGDKETPKLEFGQEMEDLEVKKTQVKRTIEDIRSSLKQKWRRGKKRGKFDMRKAMQSQQQATTRVFRRYEKGRLDETRLAVVLLIDRSGSMHGERIRKAEQAEWIITEALEETDNKVATLAFNTDVRNLKDWHQNTTYDISPRGNTDPTKALFIASKKVEDVLQYDEDINPLVIMVTDGEYDPTHQSYSSDYSPKDNAEMIEREYDGKVAEIRLSEGQNTYEDERREAFDFVADIDDMDDLPKVIEKILEQVEREFVEKYREKGGRQ